MITDQEMNFSYGVNAQRYDTYGVAILIKKLIM